MVPVRFLHNKATILFLSFLGGTGVKNPPANADNIRDADLTPGLGRCLGAGNGNPLQYLA